MNGITSIRSFQESPSILWGVLAPHAHFLQFYADDVELLDSLEAFVAEGLEGDEAVIVIATPAHRRALRDRLAPRGISVDAAIDDGRYYELDARETLSALIVDGRPDAVLFGELMRHLVERARGDGRRIRAFGEMVVMLWARGDEAATMRLEQLWSELCEEDDFALLCAYPLSDLTQGKGTMNEIIATHSKLVAV